MAVIVEHLLGVQMERGNMHLFLYTECESAKFFAPLGFYEIARVSDRLVFMENRRDGFARYIASLVPATTYDYLTGDAGRRAVANIQAAKDVVHH